MKIIKKSAILFFLSFFSLVSTKVYSQITIGSNVKPQSYETLKIVSSGQDGKGLRLPRYSTVQLDELGATMLNDEKSEGLLCYDLDRDLVVMWDGTQWLIVTVTPNVANGIHVASDIRLN